MTTTPTTTGTTAQRRIDLYAATTTKRDLRNYIIEWEQEYNQLAEAYLAQGLELSASREREARLREALTEARKELVEYAEQDADAGYLHDDGLRVDPLGSIEDVLAVIDSALTETEEPR